jgi:hypothetical protein
MSLNRSAKNDAWRFDAVLRVIVRDLREDCAGQDDLWMLAFYAAGLLAMPKGTRAECRRFLMAAVGPGQ